MAKLDSKPYPGNWKIDYSNDIQEDVRGLRLSDVECWIKGMKILRGEIE